MESEGCVLVCVTGQKTCERLIVAGADRAEKYGLALSVLHVAKPGSGLLGNPDEGAALEYLYRIASENNADMAVVRSADVTGAICKQAAKQSAKVIVIGSSRRNDNFGFKEALRLALPDIEVVELFG